MYFKLILVSLCTCSAGRHFVGMIYLNLSFRRKVTVNQYKVVLIDHLCPVMKHSDGKSVFHNDKTHIQRA